MSFKLATLQLVGIFALLIGPVLALQQKLVEAKLKRVFAEGAAAREAGQDSAQIAAEEIASADAHCNGGQPPDDASAALADANMAALLAEVDLEGEG